MAIYRGPGGSGDATTDATNQASVASDAAAAALVSQTAAANSATNAATSATAAANSASGASTSATNAASSATSAASSASTATTQATNAATSASNAATSASNAATSAADAATTYDNFDDRYLGSKASAPSVDNDGNALLTGALYWNSTSNTMNVWTGSAWTGLSGGGSGVSSFNTRTGAVTLSSSDVTTALTYTPLNPANNLSEVTASTARTNLSVPSTTGSGATGTWNIDVLGNAGTVTNGVYTTGNQTIGGTKTFSSTISGSIDGNAATVTNGVVTTGSYADPSWITSLAETKVLPSQTGNSGKYLTTNGTTTSWATVTGGSMVYPGAGIAVSTGSAWGTSLTDNSANWNTAFTERLRWDGGSTGLTASTGRTSLGATTVGSNLFTLADPSAITFPRFNADNTVSSLSASDFRTAIGAGTSSTTGTVTSVGLSAPSIFTVTNSPVTSSGTLTLSYSGTALPIANGGTGQTTAAAAYNALNPMTTTGDIIYEASASTAARLPIGTNGQVLTVVSGLPAWAASSGGSSNLDDLTDVVITSPTTGQVLKYNGTNWINDTDSTGSGSFTYPGAGIAVSTGSAWGTSLTAPTGTIVGTTDTQTLTNKRVTPRVSTTTSSATPTINTDNVDVYGLTAQAADITSFTTNLSGTPTDGQTLRIYIVGTAARAITWGASFEASTVSLPTTTVSTNRLDVGFLWNAATSKWRCVAVA